MKEFYKVVRPGTFAGDLLSVVVDSPANVVTYIIGKSVGPRRGGGPLCVFNNLSAARCFAEIWSPARIFRCKIRASQYKKVWEPDADPGTYEALDELPVHTVLASSVMLLKEVK